MRLHLALLLACVVLLSTCWTSPQDDAADVATANADRSLPAANPSLPDAGLGPAEAARDSAEAARGPAEADDAAAPPAVAPDALPALPAAGPPVAPEDPAALAALITAAEQAVRDPARRPEDLEAAGHWQQVAYRKLGQHADWVEPVVAAIPEQLHGAVRGNLFAGSRLAAMHTPADPNAPVRVRDLPPWRIVPPPPADELKAYYQEAEAATGVHWTYLAAVNLVETRMGRIRGDSTAGAQGPMQFMPATWAEWGQGDVHDHRDAIMAAARYLRWGGMPGDVNGALFRYNRDVRYVDAVRVYAEQMQGDPRAFYGYYHWQVYFNTRADNVWLAPGYDATGG